MNRPSPTAPMPRAPQQPQPRAPRSVRTTGGAGVTTPRRTRTRSGASSASSGWRATALFLRGEDAPVDVARFGAVGRVAQPGSQHRDGSEPGHPECGPHGPDGVDVALFPDADGVPRASRGSINTVASMESTRTAVLACVFAYAGMVAGRHLVPPTRRHPFQKLFQLPVPSSVLFSIFWACLLIGYLNMLIAVKFNVVELADYFVQPRFCQPWQRGRLGDWKAMLYELSMILYLIPPLGGILIARRRQYPKLQVFLVFLAVMFTFFYGFSSGTRNVFLSYLVTFLIGYCFAASKRQVKEIAIICAVCGVVTVAATKIMLDFRDVGLKDYIALEGGGVLQGSLAHAGGAIAGRGQQPLCHLPHGGVLPVAPCVHEHGNPLSLAHPPDPAGAVAGQAPGHEHYRGRCLRRGWLDGRHQRGRRGIHHGRLHCRFPHVGVLRRLLRVVESACVAEKFRVWNPGLRVGILLGRHYHALHELVQHRPAAHAGGPLLGSVFLMRHRRKTLFPGARAGGRHRPRPADGNTRPGPVAVGARGAAHGPPQPRRAAAYSPACGSLRGSWRRSRGWRWMSSARRGRARIFPTGARCTPRTAPPVGPKFFSYAPGLLGRLTRSDLDLVHLHGLWMHPSAASLAFTRRTGKPHMISPHGMLDPWALHNSGWKKRLAAALIRECEYQDGGVPSRAQCGGGGVDPRLRFRRAGVRDPEWRRVARRRMRQPVPPPPWWTKNAPEVKTLALSGPVCTRRKGCRTSSTAWSRLDRGIAQTVAARHRRLG